MELIFLVTQYKRGLTYSSLNTARWALSTVILLLNGNTFGNHPLVTRLIKGCLNKDQVCRDITAFGMYPQFLTSWKHWAPMCYSCCLVVWTEAGADKWVGRRSHSKVLSELAQQRDHGESHNYPSQHNRRAQEGRWISTVSSKKWSNSNPLDGPSRML